MRLCLLVSAVLFIGVGFLTQPASFAFFAVAADANRKKDQRPSQNSEGGKKRSDSTSLPFPSARECPTCLLFAAALRSASWKLFPRHQPGGRHADVVLDDATRKKVLQREERFIRVLTETMGITTRDFLLLAVRPNATAAAADVAGPAAGEEEVRSAVQWAYWPLSELFGKRVDRSTGTNRATLPKKSTTAEPPSSDPVAAAAPPQTAEYVAVLSEPSWNILESLYSKGGDRRIFTFVSEGVVDPFEERVEKLTRRDFLQDARQVTLLRDDMVADESQRSAQADGEERLRVLLVEPQFNNTFPPTLRMWRDATYDAVDFWTKYGAPLCSTYCKERPRGGASYGGTVPIVDYYDSSRSLFDQAASCGEAEGDRSGAACGHAGDEGDADDDDDTSQTALYPLWQWEPLPVAEQTAAERYVASLPTFALPSSLRPDDVSASREGGRRPTTE